MPPKASGGGKKKSKAAKAVTNKRRRKDDDATGGGGKKAKGNLRKLDASLVKSKAANFVEDAGSSSDEEDAALAQRQPKQRTHVFKARNMPLSLFRFSFTIFRSDVFPPPTPGRN